LAPNFTAHRGEVFSAHRAIFSSLLIAISWASRQNLLNPLPLVHMGILAHVLLFDIEQIVLLLIKMEP